MLRPLYRSKNFPLRFIVQEVGWVQVTVLMEVAKKIVPLPRTDFWLGNIYSCCSRNNQHYALICTNTLFYILAPTCFGNTLPSSGSFLDPSGLPEIQIDWVVYHIMCGYVVCVPEGSAPQLSAYTLNWGSQQTEPQHFCNVSLNSS
jgi:hypothetical protein